MRLFVAIPFDAPMQKALYQLMQHLRRQGLQGHFSRTENLHLTLAFIGEYEDVPGVISALEQVESPTFALETGDLGHFGNLLWLGLTDGAGSTGLAVAVRQCLEAAGIPFDRKTFHPHITLARRTNGKDLGVDTLSAPFPLVMPVSVFSLMSSEHTGSQLVYRTRARFPLKP